MRGFLLRRCLWMVPTLLGITFVTFLALDLAPLDRASLELAQREETAPLASEQAREVALARLRIRYGLIDPQTLEPVPVYLRYLRWLGNAVTFRLAGPDEDQAGFRRRLGAALPVSVLLGFWALVVAGAVGAPLGVWLGMRRGSRQDRAASALMFLALGIPEVLLATLLLLAFGGAGLGWLPVTGLRSEGAVADSFAAQLLDLARHLVLPVAVMAIGPTLLVARFLRESVGRAAESAFARNLDAWGIEPRLRRRRLLHVGFAPLATLAGTLLPMLVAGSIAVETVFSLDGVGRLGLMAVRSQDQAMVMAVTVLGSVVTLGALVLSDLLHRWVDPRVRLAP